MGILLELNHLQAENRVPKLAYRESKGEERIWGWGAVTQKQARGLAGRSTKPF